MSISDYNGAALIGMSGDGCVGIAADRRLGQQLSTISCDFRKIFKMNDHLYVGLGGLATDVQTFHNEMKFRYSLYELKEERPMSAKVFTHMVSNMLYAKRFGPYFIEPIIVGIDPVTGKPFISSMDLIGATLDTDEYVVTGTTPGNLNGMCESLYQPKMNPDELFETLAQALLCSVDRDAISGWGGVVYIITKDGVTLKELKGRMD